MCGKSRVAGHVQFFCICNWYLSVRSLLNRVLITADFNFLSDLHFTDFTCLKVYSSEDDNQHSWGK